MSALQMLLESCDRRIQSNLSEAIERMAEGVAKATREMEREGLTDLDRIAAIQGHFAESYTASMSFFRGALSGVNDKQKAMESAASVSGAGIEKVSYTDDHLVIEFKDGRALQAPLDWYPALKSASAADREDYLVQNSHEVEWPILNLVIHVSDILFR